MRGMEAAMNNDEQRWGYFLRAEYGTNIIKMLSNELTNKYGKGKLQIKGKKENMGDRNDTR